MMQTFFFSIFVIYHYKNFEELVAAKSGRKGEKMVGKESFQWFLIHHIIVCWNHLRRFFASKSRRKLAAVFISGFNLPKIPIFWSLCYVLAAAKKCWKCRRYLAVA
jgi:hypothetical protein